jgi:hypothetical protein
MLAGHGRIVGLAPSVWNPARRSVAVVVRGAVPGS